jgi:predicted HicB family RNase H-like nuclease
LYVTFLTDEKEKPLKPITAINGVLNIRIPAEVHGKIALISEQTGISINAFIRDSIEKRLEYAK